TGKALAVWQSSNRTIGKYSTASRAGLRTWKRPPDKRLSQAPRSTMYSLSHDAKTWERRHPCRRSFPHIFTDSRRHGCRRTEVFAGIKLFWIVGEDFANRGRHGEAQVGVNVDLGAADSARHFDVSFGHAGGFFAHSAAVLVDLLDNVLWNAGRAVENQRII